MKNKLNKFLDDERDLDNKFVVDDDEKANWALRKIKQKENEIYNVGQLVQAEVFKLEQFYDKEKQTRQNSIDYFQSLLAEYAMSKKSEYPDFKTLKLPNGSFGFRKQQPTWNYDDEVLIESLKESDLTDFIRVSEAPDKSSIKKAFNVRGGVVSDPQTGEVIKGITVEDRDDSFNVRVE